VLGSALLQAVLPVNAIEVYFRGRNTGSSGCAAFRVIQKRSGSTIQTINVGDTVGGDGLTYYLGNSWNNGDVMEVYCFRDLACGGISSKTLGELERRADYNVTTAKGDPQWSFDGASIWYDLDPGSTPPPAADWCIKVRPTNRTAYRQKYTVSTVNGVTVTEVLASPWIAPGETWTAQYCNAEKQVLRLSRLTDSDPPVYDFSDDIPTDDGGWQQDDVGADYDVNDDPTIPGANIDPSMIDFDDDATDAAKDDSVRKGFLALYGAQQQGFNGLLMSSSRINANLNTANSKLNDLNSSLSGKATTADITALKGSVDSGNSTLSGFKTANHSDLLVLHDDNLVSISKLSAITNQLANPTTPPVLTNILDELRLSRTNALAGQNISATNWQGLGGVLGSTGVTNFVGNEIGRFEGAHGVASTGSGWIEVNSFTEPDRSMWELSWTGPDGAHVIDTYPFQWEGFTNLAKLCNRFLSWGVICIAYLFAFRQVANAFDVIMLTTSPAVGVVDIATAGGWSVARRVIVAALAAVAPAAFAVWLGNNVSTLGLLTESPFLHTGILQGVLWLTEKFIPLTLAWNMFIAMMVFMLAVWAAKAIAVLVMKVMP